MITFVSGNIFESSAQVITNTINCVGVMGAGLALEFKNKFPAMFEDYKSRCEQKTVKPGMPYIWEDDKVQILNFPTKRHWRENSLMSDIDSGLQYLATNYQEMGIRSIALPQLGCGLGGLNWKDVRPLIEKYFSHIPDIEVYVYEPTLSSKKSALDNKTHSDTTPPQDKTAALPLILR